MEVVIVTGVQNNPLQYVSINASALIDMLYEKLGIKPVRVRFLTLVPLIIVYGRHAVNLARHNDTLYLEIVPLLIKQVVCSHFILIVVGVVESLKKISHVQEPVHTCTQTFNYASSSYPVSITQH